MKKKKILISIDSFFDMRLGCLNLIHQPMAADLMKTPEYHLRKDDYFKWNDDTLDRGKFREVLSKHGELILKMSLPTKLRYMLTEIIGYYLSAIGRTPWLSSLGVELNTYPYKLENVQLALIDEVYTKHICNNVPLSIVSISPSQLTPTLLATDYVALFMYNPCEWLDIHVDDIKKRIVHDVALFVPELWHGDPVDETVLKEAKDAGLTDPVTFTANLMDTFMSFRYLPPAYYCADTVWNLDEYLGTIIPTK